MVSPSQLASWQPARLSEIAESVVAHRRALTGLHDDLDAGRPPASWTLGDAASARAEHGRLSDALATQVAETTGVIEALDAAATALTAAKELLQGAMRRGGHHGLHIDHATGAVSLARTFDDEDELAYARTVQQEVAEQIETALADAAAADQALAAALTAAATTDVNHIGSLADQQTLLDFQAKSPADQVQYLLDHPDAYAFLGEHLSDEVKAEVGTHVADALDRMARDPQDFGDPELVARYTALLGAVGDDPGVMAPMYERLGADGLLGTYDGLASFMGFSDDPNLATLAAELRSGLQTATRSDAFDGTAFGEELVQLATRTADDDTMDAFFGTYPSSPMHAAVLDYLMRDGDYGEEFVRGVAWQLDEFERTVDPQMVQSWMHHTGMSPLNGLDADPASLLGRTPDPMGATMGQLGKHPELGLEFFSDADGEKRAEFYFAERDWSRDGFQGVAEAALGIGTDPENIAERGEDTGMLVSRFFGLLPENPEFTAEHAGGAAEPVGSLLKHYMQSVQVAVEGSTSANGAPGVANLTNSFLPQLQDQPVIYTGDLDKLLAVAVSTEDGMARVAEGVANFRQTALGGWSALHGAGVEIANPQSLERILTSSIGLEGHIQRVVSDAEIEGAKSKDQQVAAFTSLVSKAAALVPVPGAEDLVDIAGETGKKLADAAWSEIRNVPSGQITEIFGGNENAARELATDRLVDGQTRSVVSSFLALAEAGIVDVPPELEAIWMPDGELISLADIDLDELSYRHGEAANALGHLVSVDDLRSAYQDPFVVLSTEPR
ncbi:hypothetical protein [Cellulomonas pakistanensis]|nr:hypothetical protein [Cellulomonas pakistanensis]